MTLIKLDSYEDAEILLNIVKHFNHCGIKTGKGDGGCTRRRVMRIKHRITDYLVDNEY